MNYDVIFLLAFEQVILSQEIANETRNFDSLLDADFNEIIIMML